MNTKAQRVLLLIAVQALLAPWAEGQNPAVNSQGLPELPPLEIGRKPLIPIPPPKEGPPAVDPFLLDPERARKGNDVLRGLTGSGWRDLALNEAELKADDKLARELLAKKSPSPGWQRSAMVMMVAFMGILLLCAGALWFVRRRELR